MDIIKETGSTLFPEELIRLFIPTEKLEISPTGLAYSAYRRNTEALVTVHLLHRTPHWAARIGELEQLVKERRNVKVKGYVAPFEVGMTEEYIYFVTPFLLGRSLTTTMSERVCPPDLMLLLTAEVSRVIGDLQGEGISHGNIRSSSIFHDGSTVQLVDLCYPQLYEEQVDDLEAIGLILKTWMEDSGIAERLPTSMKWTFNSFLGDHKVEDGRIAAESLYSELESSLGVRAHHRSKPRKRPFLNVWPPILVASMTIGSMLVAAGLG